MTKEAGKVVSIREEITSQPSLDDRIADAFEAALSSADLKALLDEVEATNAAAQATSKAAAERAVDPKVRPAEVAEARRQMEDANFRSMRMEAAAEQLKDLHKQALYREAKERDQAEYEAARAERDQLVKDLQRYPELAGEIVSLLQRLTASNERIAAVNGRHVGKEALQSAEVLTRGAVVGTDSWFPSLLGGTMLPGWQRGEGSMGYIWARGRI